MKILSEQSYRAIEVRNEALNGENQQLKDRNTRLARKCRELETAYQTLVLRLGLKGYEVAVVPEVPARPATLALKKSRE